ncbi:MAG: alpha/beta hydrolase [Rhizomicrobium sp.]|nr:alpha/beta hydrolase [Rhizomicrobium sp.]
MSDETVSKVDFPELETPLAALAGRPPEAPQWFREVVAVVPQHEHVMVEGARVHYLRWGDRSKPGLLLVHGNAAHAYWWSVIAPFLSRDYHVVAIDLSGMGDSEWRPAGYSMECFASEVLAVCEHSGMLALDEPPVIIGHSFGGFVTILAGALYGERLAGTIILDSPVNPPDRPRPGPPAFRPHNIYPDIAAALARFRLLPPQVCENLYLLDYVARHSLRQVGSGFTWKFDPQIWRNFSIGDMAARLRDTKCRIAIFRGEHSILMPPAIGEFMFNLLGRSAPVVEIPQAQHHMMLDQPLALVAALRAVLADWEHSDPSRSPDEPDLD